MYQLQVKVQVQVQVKVQDHLDLPRLPGGHVLHSEGGPDHELLVPYLCHDLLCMDDQDLFVHEDEQPFQYQVGTGQTVTILYLG